MDGIGEAGQINCPIFTDTIHGAAIAYRSENRYAAVDSPAEMASATTSFRSGAHYHTGLMIEQRQKDQAADWLCNRVFGGWSVRQRCIRMVSGK